AQELYGHALAGGQSSFLLQQEEAGGDVFSCSLGNLPPGEEAMLTLSYTCKLPLEHDGAARYVLPTVLHPRYTPHNPPHAPHGPHPPDLYSREPNHCPGSLMGDPAVMMTLLPRVPEAVPAQSQPGSLSSCWAAPAARPAPWTQRPGTLVLLLKSLPLDCYFNICGFGQSVENTQQTKAESLQRLQLLQAHLGGTEILEPLRAVYRSPCRDGHPCQMPGGPSFSPATPAALDTAQPLAPPGDSPTPQAESPAPPNPELQASGHSDSSQLLRFKP
ncbi:unnamed protein product, partial [Caretta caretta]